MAFFDKLNDFAKNIGDKTTDAIETGKLNSKINAENTAAGEELKKIGAYYYNLFIAGDENKAVAPEVLEFCQNAKAHYEAAAAAQAEIEKIKADNEAAKAAAAAQAAAPVTPIVPAAAPSAGLTCSACGFVNAEGTKFCQNCGGKLEPPAPVVVEGNICPGCGATNDAGVKFCRECGRKLEAPVPAPEVPAKRFCVSCGTEMAPGVKFCPQCGQKNE